MQDPLPIAAGEVDCRGVGLEQGAYIHWTTPTLTNNKHCRKFLNQVLHCKSSYPARDTAVRCSTKSCLSAAAGRVDLVFQWRTLREEGLVDVRSYQIFSIYKQKLL